jgi:hypothetical protein
MPNKTDQLEELRKLLDRKRWPKYDAIVEGELFRFRSDDPEEECVYKVLYK